MSQLKSYKPEITDFLMIFLEQKKRQSHQVSLAKTVFQKLLKFAPRGKMLRGSLLIETYLALGGKNLDQAVQLAAAQELAGAAFLIHDDIIDQDEVRRGQVSIHAQYADQARKSKYPNPTHVGESLGMCVGDIGFFLVFEILSTLNQAEELKHDIIALFARAFSAVALGEMLDVDLSFKTSASASEIFRVMIEKTGRYTFSLSMLAGAMLADANQGLIDKLDDLGETLSVIFQIKDDELGLVGDEKLTGKPVGSDIREGKKTLYHYYLMKLASAADQRRLKTIFSDPNLNQAQVELVRKLLVKSGVMKKVGQIVDQYVVMAQKQIEQLPVDADFKAKLQNFVEFLLKRNI